MGKSTKTGKLSPHERLMKKARTIAKQCFADGDPEYDTPKVFDCSTFIERMASAIDSELRMAGFEAEPYPWARWAWVNLMHEDGSKPTANRYQGCDIFG